MSLLLRPLRLAFARSHIHPLPPLYFSSWRDAIHEKWQSQDEIDEARRWLSTFSESSIPRKNCVVSFSQCSGPGGQKVNRSSTKATLHLDLKHKAGFLPDMVLQKVLQNSRHVTRDQSIVIQCDETRSQHDNIEHAFRRLFNILTAAVREDLPGETSPEKHKHVIELQKAEREGRMKIKNQQKMKKDSRRNKGGNGLD